MTAMVRGLWWRLSKELFVAIPGRQVDSKIDRFSRSHTATAANANDVSLNAMFLNKSFVCFYAAVELSVSANIHALQRCRKDVYTVKVSTSKQGRVSQSWLHDHGHAGYCCCLR